MHRTLPAPFFPFRHFGSREEVCAVLAEKPKIPFPGDFMSIVAFGQTLDT